MAGLRVRDAVLDGEIVCLDDEGRSQFNTLLRRRGQPAFYAFDLLWLNGKDLRNVPLVRRKDRLRKLIEKNYRESVMYAQHIPYMGIALYQEVCRRNLEGIVCKKKDGAYSATAQWLKVMNPDYTQHEDGMRCLRSFESHERRMLRRFRRAHD